jgi:hypothetical protein
MRRCYSVLIILFISTICYNVQAVTIYVKSADSNKAGYILGKNDKGVWQKNVYYPISNFLTKETLQFNINKYVWEKEKNIKNKEIYTIFRINQDGTKDISYNKGLKWYKTLENKALKSSEIITYFNKNEETINYQLNNENCQDVKQIKLFDMFGREIYRTKQIQNEGKIDVKNVYTNVLFVYFETGNVFITKKVIIQ